MNPRKVRIYLASGSPRRREILESLGFLPERVHADIDESVLPGEDAVSYTRRLASEKAAAGWRVAMALELTPRPLLSADTTVVLDGEIFGKPLDAADAMRMLQAFSGRTHQVVTSVAVRLGDRTEVISSTTDVTFKTLSEQEIERYLDTGEPFDKAGAYGIQGMASVFVSHIAGSFSGVVGLPIFETAQLLAAFDIQLP